uniref:EF-hand domain-containing protein n=1 Tax=Haptolina ericina TaxID=156174 RepID=A0A7S3EYR5_9EUKA
MLKALEAANDKEAVSNERLDLLQKGQVELIGQTASLTDAWFEASGYDDSTPLMRGQVMALLEHVNHSAPPPTDEAMDFIMMRAGDLDSEKKKKKKPQKKKSTIPLEVHGSAAKQVAAMYSDYVAEQPYLDSVFIAHDVDGSTRIELGELMGFMQEITNGMGIDIGLADVQFIMDSCGHDPHDGGLPPETLLPVAAMWKHCLRILMGESTATAPPPAAAASGGEDSGAGVGGADAVEPAAADAGSASADAKADGTKRMSFSDAARSVKGASKIKRLSAQPASAMPRASCLPAPGAIAAALEAAEALEKAKAWDEKKAEEHKLKDPKGGSGPVSMAEMRRREAAKREAEKKAAGGAAASRKTKVQSKFDRAMEKLRQDINPVTNEPIRHSNKIKRLQNQPASAMPRASCLPAPGAIAEALKKAERAEGADVAAGYAAVLAEQGERAKSRRHKKGHASSSEGESDAEGLPKLPGKKKSERASSSDHLSSDEDGTGEKKHRHTKRGGDKPIVQSRVIEEHEVGKQKVDDDTATQLAALNRAMKKQQLAEAKKDKSLMAEAASELAEAQAKIAAAKAATGDVTDREASGSGALPKPKSAGKKHQPAWEKMGAQGESRMPSRGVVDANASTNVLAASTHNKKTNRGQKIQI